jgi:hypothetical protein
VNMNLCETDGVGDSEGAEEAQIHGRHIGVVSTKLSRHLCRMLNSCRLCRGNMTHHGRENRSSCIIVCLSRHVSKLCLHYLPKDVCSCTSKIKSHSFSHIGKCISSKIPTAVTSWCTLKYRALYHRS